VALALLELGSRTGAQNLGAARQLRLPPAPHPQVSLLRRLFKAALGEEAARMVDINTIDGFQVRAAAAALGWLHAPLSQGGSTCLLPQRAPRLRARFHQCAGVWVRPATPPQGREKDVAFFSTVRSQRGSRGIGFVADERRINVGLTRARWALPARSYGPCWAGRRGGLQPRQIRHALSLELACNAARLLAPSCLPTLMFCFPPPLQGHPGCGGPRGVTGDKPTLVGAGVARSPTKVHVQSRCVGWWLG
jgi:hypothetical protein